MSSFQFETRHKSHLSYCSPSNTVLDNRRPKTLLLMESNEESGPEERLKGQTEVIPKGGRRHKRCVANIAAKEKKCCLKNKSNSSSLGKSRNGGVCPGVVIIITISISINAITGLFLPLRRQPNRKTMCKRVKSRVSGVCQCR